MIERREESLKSVTRVSCRTRQSARSTPRPAGSTTTGRATWRTRGATLSSGARTATRSRQSRSAVSICRHYLHTLACHLLAVTCCSEVNVDFPDTSNFNAAFKGSYSVSTELSSADSAAKVYQKGTGDSAVCMWLAPIKKWAMGSCGSVGQNSGYVTCMLTQSSIVSCLEMLSKRAPPRATVLTMVCSGKLPTAVAGSWTPQ